MLQVRLLEVDPAALTRDETFGRGHRMSCPLALRTLG